MVYERYIREYAARFSETDRDIWNYEDGCVLIGLLAMYGVTGDGEYFRAIRQFMDRYISPDGTIRHYNREEYNLDFIPSGRALFDLYRETGEEKYRKAIEALEEQLRHQPRTKCGNFWHKKIYPYQVWLDGLYMGQPFYMMYENAFGDKTRYSDVTLQFRNAREHLYDPTTGLYYHAWDESRKSFWCDKTTGLSPNFWTRAIGWYLMALADVYELMPEDRQEEKEELAQEWLCATEGMLRWQDTDSGLFWQVTNLPDYPGNYLETSGSLMTAYSLFKGVRLGMGRDARRICAAQQIMMGNELRQFTVHGGHLSLGGMCKGAGLGPEGNERRNGSVEYYLSEAIVNDEQKGVGVCMMAYAEYLRARDAGILTEGYPIVELFNQKYDPILPEEIERARRENEADCVKHA